MKNDRLFETKWEFLGLRFFFLENIQNFSSCTYVYEITLVNFAINSKLMLQRYR